MGSSHSFWDVCRPSAPSTCGYVCVGVCDKGFSIEVSSSSVLRDFGSIVFLEH